jgi:hypothetical protein
LFAVTHCQTASSPLYFKEVITLAYSSATIPPRDSGREVGDWRASLAEAVLAMLRALVLFTVRGLSQWADRTSFRNQLNAAGAIALDGAQPEPTWTITPNTGTPLSRDAAPGRDPARRATHHFSIRRPRPDESPGRLGMTGTDETRNPDQREPARNAGRHPRGRPAR